MAKNRTETHPVAAAWSASGSINLELSPKPYTITEMDLDLYADVSTGASVTAVNDLWDRIIATLALTGKGKTYFAFSNGRALRHFNRFIIKQPRRAAPLAVSQSNAKIHVGYKIHFGVEPARQFDLTAGIPPSESGNLSLTGTWGAAAAPGTGYTINSANLYVTLHGVMPEAGDSPVQYLPRAFPIWSQRTPTPVATSSRYATQDNIPAGGFLHSLLVMTFNGSDLPRDDGVLNSIQLYAQTEAREIIKYDIWKIAEIMTQARYRVDPYLDDEIAEAGASTVPSAVPCDKGLVWLQLVDYATKGNALYGADLRGVNTGDLQFRYGVDDASGVEMHVIYRKYELNPAHPQNLGS